MHLNRQAVLRKMFSDVHKTLCRSRAQGARFSRGASIFLDIPGLLYEGEVEGVTAKTLLSPHNRLDVRQREQFVWDVLPYIPPENAAREGRTMLKEAMGSQCADFILLGKTTENRLVRLLWLMGQDQNVTHAPQSLIISGPDGQYGVSDGEFFGGPFAGYPVNIDTTELLFTSKKVRCRSQTALEARRILLQRKSHDAYQKFCILYVIAQWDKSIPIDSMMLSRGSTSYLFFEKLEAKVMESEEPYKVLHATLVPHFMTYGDFYNLIGNPASNANLNVQKRLRLMAKVRSLPFFE